VPSPFPGMDPWLEARDRWRSFHNVMVTAMTAALNSTLPRHIRAQADVRVYVVEPDRDILPDVTVLETRPSHPLRHGGTAVAEPDQPQVAEWPAISEREAYIEIRAIANPSRVLTVIELLSPSNKSPGSTGFREYAGKQEHVLKSEVNLVEIDLLRGGAHTVAVPKQAVERRGAYDYLVCLHRATERYRYEFWPFALRDRLPRIAVPLDVDMSDAVLELQPALAWAYDNGGFEGTIDYRQPPTPPLSESESAWADGLLREAGYRA